MNKAGGKKSYRVAACQRTGKRRYRSLEVAQLAVEDATWWREHGQERRQERRAYACEHCGGWHVTSQPLKTALPKVSKKRAKEQAQRTRMLVDTFGSSPVCARCGAPADDAHELLSRGRGGSITDPDNIVPLCRRCHTWITINPALAEAEGWAKPSKGPR